MTIEEKLAQIVEALGGKHNVDTTMAGLIKGLGKSYTSIFKKGTKCVLDIDKMKRVNSWYAKNFDNALEPVTITYKRQDVVFYKFDNHPQLGEHYIIESDNGAFNRNLYIKELRLSEAFKNKIKKLKDTNLNELMLQVSIVEFNTHGITEVINDLEGIKID